VSQQRPITLTFGALPRDLAYRAAGILSELMDPPPGAVSIFEDPAGWRVIANYDRTPHDQAGYIATLSGLLETDLSGCASWQDLPDINWVELSQVALPPVVTQRFKVHGSHDRARVPQGPWSIEIEAGEAFGTAHHATTYGCLDALHRLSAVCRPQTVLDLGTGTGILAIAAARQWPQTQIVASDIDDDAVRVARANVRGNGCCTRVCVKRADGVTSLARGGRNFDVVIANILAGPLIAMSQRISAIVKGGGYLTLSGILTPQARAVQAAYRRHGLIMTSSIHYEGWSVLTLKKRPVA